MISVLVGRPGLSVCLSVCLSVFRTRVGSWTQTTGRGPRLCAVTGVPTILLLCHVSSNVNVAVEILPDIAVEYMGQSFVTEPESALLLLWWQILFWKVF